MIALLRREFWFGVALRSVQLRAHIADGLTRVHDVALRRALGI